MRREPVFEGTQLFKDAAGAGQYLFALGGQLKAAAAPDKQRQAKVALQLLNLSAHRALGQAELLRRLGEAA
ncbi:hypothetical protein D9M71_199040 [compost metagenome]